MSFLYILDMNLLSDIRLANVFFSSLGCLFILLMVFFAEQKLLSFLCSHLLIFTCIAFVSVVKLKKKMMSRCLPPVFFQEFYGFKSYIGVFIHFELLFVCGV